MGPACNVWVSVRKLLCCSLTARRVFWFLCCVVDVDVGVDRRQAYVGSSGQSQVGVAPIRDIVKRLTDASQRRVRVIIIGPCKLSPQAKVEIQQEAHKKNIVEYFMEAELLFDITEHTLVPKHEVLTPAEKQALLSKYRLSGLMLPQIKVTDPVARFFGMQAGQVARITRKTKGNATCVTYRIVIAPKML